MTALAPEFGHFQSLREGCAQVVLDDHSVTPPPLVACNGELGAHLLLAKQRERRHCQRVHPNSCVRGGAVPSLINPSKAPIQNTQVLSTRFTTAVLLLFCYAFNSLTRL